MRWCASTEGPSISGRPSSLTELAEIRDKLAAARIRVAELERQRDQLMVTAIEEREQVPTIAKASGVSRGRVYQIKDRVQRPGAQ